MLRYLVLLAATAAETVIERAEGKRPSRTRAFLVAAAAAVAAGTIAYKLLRRESLNRRAAPAA